MQQFSKAAFADPARRDALMTELARVITARLQGADFHAGVMAIIEELRGVGHDLWSFDESHDFAIWCPDYVTPTGPGIIVRFERARSSTVEWG